MVIALFLGGLSITSLMFCVNQKKIKEKLINHIDFINPIIFIDDRFRYQE